MFEEIKQWLDGLTPQEKQNLVNNLNSFKQLWWQLERKGVIKKDPRNGDLVIMTDHLFLDTFLKLHKDLKIQGVKIVDTRLSKA